MKPSSPTKTPLKGLRNKVLILLIGLSAVIPFGLAWRYAEHPEWIEKTSNYGVLFAPGLSLQRDELLAAPLNDQEGFEQIRGRWILIQVAGAACALACSETLHKTHQGWLMLNKEMPRVKRLLLVPGPKTIEASPAIQQDDALQVALLKPSILDALTRAMGRPPEEGMLVLVDPQANLVLWYESGFDPYKMVRDLKHLLKASQIG
ncbi:MAG: hypothetical protein D4R76_10815 [Methylococcus sp.]|jgi:hypothetical protein|nr:MAG: hypothetical protein D4R76_10815 [Methylococcus sp.]